MGKLFSTHAELLFLNIWTYVVVVLLACWYGLLILKRQARYQRDVTLGVFDLAWVSYAAVSILFVLSALVNETKTIRNTIFDRHQAITLHSLHAENFPALSPQFCKNIANLGTTTTSGLIGAITVPANACKSAQEFDASAIRLKAAQNSATKSCAREVFDEFNRKLFENSRSLDSYDACGAVVLSSGTCANAFCSWQNETYNMQRLIFAEEEMLLRSASATTYKEIKRKLTEPMEELREMVGQLEGTSPLYYIFFIPVLAMLLGLRLSKAFYDLYVRCANDKQAGLDSSEFSKIFKTTVNWLRQHTITRVLFNLNKTTP